MSNVQEMLLSQLQDPNAKVKVASKFGSYVKDRMREASFVEQIIPSEPIDRSRCQVSENHDALVKMEFVAPKSRASVVTFRGEGEANFIRGSKVPIPFITIMSDMFQKPEQEFMAYDYPIGQVINEQSVKDLSEIQDREFLIHAEAACQALQAEANGGSVTTLNASAIQGGSVVEYSVIKGELARVSASDDAVVHPLQKRDLVSLMQVIDSRRLETAMFLMTAPDWDSLMAMTVEDVGSPAQSEILYEGIKRNTLLGKRYVKSIKTDILRRGNVYSFCAPEFLGRNYLLNNVKFYIDKIVNMVKFCCWKDIGMAIINISAVAKLELYSGDATTLNADTIQSDVTPMAESDLGAENNRVGNRQFYPNVVVF
jgi:hypothetical protein